VRTVSETVVRCDVCGLLKEREVRGWRTLKLSFHSNEDTNDSNKRRDWSREFSRPVPEVLRDDAEASVRRAALGGDAVREGRHQSVDRSPTIEPLKRRVAALHPNLCVRCNHNSYDERRLTHCRLCGSALKLPAGWELSGTDPYGYHKG
jgi:hypothetical protein